MLLLPNIFPDSTIAANLKLHRTKCTALLVNLVSPCLFDELIKDVGQSFYSLIVDESTDVSQSKMLAFCIRYFSMRNQEIVTTFLKIVPLGEFATSDAIGDTICKFLRDAGLTLDRLIGIGVDGCSTIVGVHHSLATYFRELIPHIVIFKCVCHSLQLAASKVADTLPAHLDFMGRESYNWFSHSPKRLIQYEELHKCLTNGYAFISNAERLKIPKKNLDEVKQRCLTFLVEATKQVQMRLPENVSVFQDMAGTSPEEVFKVQELTSLTTRFPNITSNIDDLNKEVISASEKTFRQVK